MVEIVKKAWPESFKSLHLGERNCDVRINDFKVSEGDIIVFKEWDPEKKRFTGNEVRKVVKRVSKTDLFKYYSVKELNSKGLLLIEFMESIE